ncbi:hypothetical protein J2S68_001865 [Glycomyces algeriensis]|nr:hypothetical protein [Glycomyces algeriensis]
MRTGLALLLLIGIMAGLVAVGAVRVEEVMAGPASMA